MEFNSSALNYNFSRLNTEISQSVKSLKARNSGSHSTVDEKEQGSQHQPRSAKSFAGYKVSYLESSSAFNLQKMISDQPGAASKADGAWQQYFSNSGIVSELDESQNYPPPSGITKYAVGAYEYVLNVNNEPKVLIDFMHPNNRSYNYKI